MSNCVTLQNFVATGQTVAEISQFLDFRIAAAAILDFRNLKILTVGTVSKVVLRHRAKFCRNISNRSQYMAIFQDGEFLTIGRDQSVELRHGAKFPNMIGLLQDPVL